MRKLLAMGMLLALTGAPMLAAPPDNEKEVDRLENAGMVMDEIMNIPDNIPQDLIDKAECVIVFPSVLKAAFIVGGSYGRGAMVCRSGEHFTGPWGAPSMMALEGGSLGFQLGGQATDFVLLVMNPRGAKAILNSKVKLGGDMSAAAGPKGRDASADTDATLRAEILSYSRARGLFAGISLEGSTLRPDNDANEKLYGKKIDRDGNHPPGRGADTKVRTEARFFARKEIAQESFRPRIAEVIPRPLTVAASLTGMRQPGGRNCVRTNCFWKYPAAAEKSCFARPCYSDSYDFTRGANRSHSDCGARGMRIRGEGFLRLGPRLERD